MRLRNMKMSGLFVAAAWFLLPFGLGDAHAQTTKVKPNILFILTDDQSPHDLKVYDPDSTLETPVLDQLADHLGQEKIRSVDLLARQRPR